MVFIITIGFDNQFITLLGGIDYICEGCNETAPFETKSGPYLEVHHLTRLADGGADLPQNVIALCPTCHRKAHYSLDYLEFNNQLINKVATIEAAISEQYI